MRIKQYLTGVAAAGLLGFCPNTQAVSFGFNQLSNNAGQDISSQLMVDVTDAGGELCFMFSNVGTIPSVITQIYFDDAPAGAGNGLGHLGSVVNFSSADWRAYDVSPPDLPGGNLADPKFTVDGNPILYATAVSPSPKNGAGLGESLAIYLAYKTGSGTLADVIEDLKGGALRIGLHVQSIGTSGKSDAYITGKKDSSTTGNGTPVPDGGATSVLLGMGLTVLGIGSLKHLKRSRC